MAEALQQLIAEGIIGFHIDGSHLPGEVDSLKNAGAKIVSEMSALFGKIEGPRDVTSALKAGLAEVRNEGRVTAEKLQADLGSIKIGVGPRPVAAPVANVGGDEAAVIALKKVAKEESDAARKTRPLIEADEQLTRTVKQQVLQLDIETAALKHNWQEVQRLREELIKLEAAKMKSRGVAEPEIQAYVTSATASVHTRTDQTQAAEADKTAAAAEKAKLTAEQEAKAQQKAALATKEKAEAEEMAAIATKKHILQIELETATLEKDWKEVEKLKKEMVELDAEMMKLKGAGADQISKFTDASHKQIEASMVGKSGSLKSQLKSMAEGVKEATAMFIGPAAIGIAAAMTVEKLIDVAKETVTVAAEMQHLSEATGISVQNLTRLEYAGKIYGLSMDTITRGITNLSKVMVKGEDETGRQTDALKKLGISALDSKGHLKQITEVVEEVADKFSKMNPAERLGRASAIFGRQLGREFIPLLASGKTHLKELFDEADRVGFTLDHSTTEGALRAQMAFRRLEAEGLGVLRRGLSATFALVDALSDEEDDAGEHVKKAGEHSKTTAGHHEHLGHAAGAAATEHGKLKTAADEAAAQVKTAGEHSGTAAGQHEHLGHAATASATEHGKLHKAAGEAAANVKKVGDEAHDSAKKTEDARKKLGFWSSMGLIVAGAMVMIKGALKDAGQYLSAWVRAALVGVNQAVRPFSLLSVGVAILGSGLRILATNGWAAMKAMVAVFTTPAEAIKRGGGMLDVIEAIRHKVGEIGEIAQQAQKQRDAEGDRLAKNLEEFKQKWDSTGKSAEQVYNEQQKIFDQANDASEKNWQDTTARIEKLKATWGQKLADGQEEIASGTREANAAEQEATIAAKEATLQKQLETATLHKNWQEVQRLKDALIQLEATKMRMKGVPEDVIGKFVKESHKQAVADILKTTDELTRAQKLQTVEMKLQEAEAQGLTSAIRDLSKEKAVLSAEEKVARGEFTKGSKEYLAFIELAVRATDAKLVNTTATAAGELLNFRNQIAKTFATATLSAADQERETARANYEKMYADLEKFGASHVEKWNEVHALEREATQAHYAQMTHIDNEYANDWRSIVHRIGEATRKEGAETKKALEQFATGIVDSISTGMADVFFDTLSLNFKKAADDAKAFLKGLLRDIITFITRQEVMKFIGFALGFVGGSTSTSGVIASGVTSASAGWGSQFGSSGSISGHATGGVFATPHVANIAENGPEAVIPMPNGRLHVDLGAGAQQKAAPVDLKQTIVIAPEFYAAMRPSAEEIITIVNADYARNGMTRRNFRMRGQ